MNNHVLSELTAYLHNELDKAERFKVSDHLIDCESCQVAYKELSATQNALSAFPVIVPSAGFAARVLKGTELMRDAEVEADWIIEEMEEMAALPQPLTAPWYAVASLLVVLGLFFLLTPSSISHPEISKPATLRDWDALPRDNSLSSTELVPKKPTIDEMVDFNKELNADDNKLLNVKVVVDPEQDDPFKDLPKTVNEVVDIHKFNNNPKKDVQPVMDEEPIIEFKKESPVVEIKSKDPEPEPDLIEINKQETVPEYWVQAEVNDKGQIIGAGQRVALNTALGALLMNREGNFPQTKQTVDYLMVLDAKKGLGRSLYEHALITYTMALLVEEGQDGLKDNLKKAIKFLISRQNADGGWSWALGFKKNALNDPSNSLVSGWAVLCLGKTQHLKIKKSKSSIYKCQTFFKRLTDPRDASTGFVSRGDKRETSLCSVLSTLSRYITVTPKRLRQTTKSTMSWVLTGVEKQHRYVRSQVDYDFLFMSKLFYEALGKGREWKNNNKSLLKRLKKTPAQSYWNRWSLLSRRLFLESIQ